MRLRHLTIRRFRGIRELDWSIGHSTVCLIGPGDSTKSTVLEAVEWVLSPRWNLSTADTDFHGVHTDEPIIIEVTLSELPESLLSEKKFGLALRGWGADGSLNDEPQEGDEPALTLRLTIDDSLEPQWAVVNDRQPEGQPISAKDREALGAARLGVDVDRHLAWGRGSALLRLTDSTSDMSRTLANAHRAARAKVGEADLTDLREASGKAAAAAAAMGAGILDDLKPAMDAGTGSLGAGSLGLHAGPLPLRMSGMGTRRLAALGVQRASVERGAIVLVDEVETGLEPHRLRHALRELSSGDVGQALMTTHSEISIVELPCESLHIVRCVAGTVSITAVDGTLQALVRRAPDALLGRRIIVCEGKTELGLCRALDNYWAGAHDDARLAQVGVVVVADNGSDAAAADALALCALGYPTAVLIDSDQPYKPDEAELRAAGVAVYTWEGSLSTDERVFLDVPDDAFQQLLDLAADISGTDAVMAGVANQLGGEAGGRTVEEWRAEGHSDSDIRVAVGTTAKRLDWFKRTDLGERMGTIVAGALAAIPETNLAAKLNALGEWAHER